MCEDVSKIVYDLLASSDHLNEMPRLQKKTRIVGKECIISPRVILEQFTIEELNARLEELIDEMNKILNNTETGVAKFSIDFNSLFTQDLSIEKVRLPETRQTGKRMVGYYFIYACLCELSFITPPSKNFLLEHSSSSSDNFVSNALKKLGSYIILGFIVWILINR